MIVELEIQNFKSIKKMDLACKKVNVFIGEPNVGKSNILEALGLLSSAYYKPINDMIRLDSPANMFYDEDLHQSVIISATFDPAVKKMSFTEFTIDFDNDRFICRDQVRQIFSLDYNFYDQSHSVAAPYSFVKFFRYKDQLTFPKQHASNLYPPFGENLFAVIMANKQLKDQVSSMFRRMNLSLGLKSKERTLEAVKHIDEVFYTYPYITLSDTLKRMIFYIAAMETNSDSTLIFEEPESNSFPFYTKELAERIGMDHNGNQFFLTTHNPYFLETIIEKTPEKHLSIFNIYYEKYQTKLKLLKSNEISEMLDEEPFFILDRFRN
jgi:AAA15 family ATPase/GTPase